MEVGRISQHLYGEAPEVIQEKNGGVFALYYSKLGLIRADHLDNDLPFKRDSEIDTSPGSLYDRLVKHVEQRPSH